MYVYDTEQNPVVILDIHGAGHTKAFAKGPYIWYKTQTTSNLWLSNIAAISRYSRYIWPSLEIETENQLIHDVY